MPDVWQHVAYRYNPKSIVANSVEIEVYGEQVSDDKGGGIVACEKKDVGWRGWPVCQPYQNLESVRGVQGHDKLYDGHKEAKLVEKDALIAPANVVSAILLQARPAKLKLAHRAGHMSAPWALLNENTAAWTRFCCDQKAL